ncbi:unnamed protein product, partial [Meganyctiphanes norvegica]
MRRKIEELIKVQSIEIKLKEEIETHEEPIAFTGESYLKHEKLDLVEHLSGDKPHKCRKINKTIFHESDIVLHRSQTGEKPNQCRQYYKFFSNNSSIIENQRKHTGEKSYQCSQCNKAFSKNSNLKSHQRTHTGE